MIHLAISVEGQTEEEFVKTLIATHLHSYDVNAQPIQLHGAVSETKLVKEMLRLVSGRFDGVTSLVDFYGFVKKGDRSCEELEDVLCTQIRKKLRSYRDKERVFPYVQKHEFEGLLFSDVAAFGILPNAPRDATKELRRVRRQFHNPKGPEDINDNENTAPSKRISRIVPQYNKVADGMRVARKIGLSKIREECPRFHAWIEKMEGLAQ